VGITICLLARMTVYWPPSNRRQLDCSAKSSIILMCAPILLQISELSHTVINALSFRVEYRRGSGGTAMFQRQVRFQIDLSDVTNTHSPRDYLFAIIFTLHSGRCRWRSANKCLLIIIINVVVNDFIYDISYWSQRWAS